MQNADEYYNSIDLHIRWAEGQDLILTVSPKDTVSKVKQKIRQCTPRTENKHLRLIHNGRILSDEKALIDYGLGKLHYNSQSKAKIPPPEPVYIHCSISEHTTSSHSNDQPQLTIPTGFDRLREAGFSEEDIQNIRSQFHRLHGIEGDGNSDEARQLEEQWMDSTGDTLPDGTLQGTYREMIWGLMLGFFLGAICLFWFRESVFTRRHQIGIVAGLFVNISFGLVAHWY